MCKEVKLLQGSLGKNVTSVRKSTLDPILLSVYNKYHQLYNVIYTIHIILYSIYSYSISLYY